MISLLMRSQIHWDVDLSLRSHAVIPHPIISLSMPYLLSHVTSYDCHVDSKNVIISWRGGKVLTSDNLKSSICAKFAILWHAVLFFKAKFSTIISEAYFCSRSSDCWIILAKDLLFFLIL